MILYLDWDLKLRKNNMTMARKRDLIMETPTCKGMEEEKSMGMNISILAPHLVVEITIGEVMEGIMEIPFEWI